MIQEFNGGSIQISIESGTDIIKRLTMLLGHYDLRVFISDTAYVDIGRGSLEGALRIDYARNDAVGCVGSIGQFCDFAPDCKLYGGGEHHNSLPVNVVMTGVPAFRGAAANHKIGNLQAITQSPFSIGNAVVISSGVRVLTGSQIGDCTVIAAGGLVRGTAEAYSIYGGLPAKKLKDRVDVQTLEAMRQVRWWDFDIEYLGNHLDSLQSASVDTAAGHIYRKPAPRFILKLLEVGKPGQLIQIMGFIDNGISHGSSDMPEVVRAYIGQLASKTDSYQWIADVWN